MSEKRKSKYKTISLPVEMLNRISDLVELRPELGFKSMSDFVTSAIRSHPDYRRLIEEERDS